MSALLTAAQSYYGLADTNVRKSELFTADGATIIVFEMEVTDEDMAGIVDRMKRMQEEARPQSDGFYLGADGNYYNDDGTLKLADPSVVSRDDMRATYSALSPAERSKYGSFARYVALGGGADPYVDPVAQGVDGREVRHVDAPEPEDSGKPEAVWVDWKDLTPEQIMMASDTNGEIHLIQVVMLTPEQRARYVQPGEK